MHPLSYARRFGLVNQRGYELSNIPSLEGRTAVITGGQSGIGREITIRLLLHGISKVYILARTESKYEDAKKDWVEHWELQQEDVDKRAEFIKCDLSDIVSVRDVAGILLQKLDRLDMLYNNAGKYRVLLDWQYSFTS